MPMPDNISSDDWSLFEEDSILLSQEGSNNLVDYSFKREDTDKGFPFAHMHLHTFHSILDGCGSIDDYIKLAKKFDHPAMAITDHGTMSGLFEFYTKCKKNGIKPILGMEAYVNDNIDKFATKKEEGSNFHQIIYIMNKVGYENLNKLSYLSFTEGFYKKGRITTEQLIKNKEGLFITTACIGSKINKLFINGKVEEAEKYIILLKKEFGDNFAIEIQLNSLDIQKTVNSFLIEMANKHDIMTILTNDVHYAYPEDAELQDTLLAINQKKQLGKSFVFTVRNCYYANSNDFFYFNRKYGYNYPDEFITLCLTNTLKIVQKCNFDFDTQTCKFPKYEPDEDIVGYFKTNNVKEIITKLANAKLIKKLKEYQKNGIVKINSQKVKEYKDRLNYEISVIDEKNMLDYFMVNWEIINDYRKHGHVVGPGRGSAAGCLLTWCLDITKIDPIRFELYFERFLNPTRKGFPDLDIDFEADTDYIVDNFLIKKYGKDRILKVCTFLTFNEKGCLKDVVRAHKGQEETARNSDIERVINEMPDFSKVDFDLETWFKEYPNDKNCSKDVKKWLTDSTNKKIIEQTLKLQGQIRGIGRHAAGVVITPDSCWKYIPVNMVVSGEKKEHILVTAFQEADKSGKDLSALQILKLDRLKLETLNVIEDTIKLVKSKKNIDIREQIDYIDLNDQGLYEELKLGINHGIFQFESAGIKKIVKDLNIESFDEIVAVNALYRPGALNLKSHEDYIKNKFNPNGITYIHPALESILKPTNGVLMFQEQIMFIANKIGGMSLGDGDMLRRYMDKAGKLIELESKGLLTEEDKNSDKYQNFKKYWEQFLDGAERKGYNKSEVNVLKNWIIKYLGYSFNKSHSVSYAYIAAQTLYLKRYYPTEFYTSLLNHSKTSGGKNKVQSWLAASIMSAISKDIKIKPPSLKSKWRWTMTCDKEISMGFSSINGLGEIAYRELTDLVKKTGKNLETITTAEFFNLPFSKFNKKAFESCVKAGVFDSWSNSRQYIMSLKSKKKTQINANQLCLYDINELGSSLQLQNSSFASTDDVEKRIQFFEVCNIDLQKVEIIANIKMKLFKKAGRVVESVINFELDDIYFFLVENIIEKNTVKGDPYGEIKIGDGINSMFLRVFSPIYNIIKGKLIINSIYAAEFEKNKNGFVSFKKGGRIRKIA